MADDEGKQTGDSTMFAIFIFSMALLAALPLTCWRISSGAGGQQAAVQPWLSGASAKPSATSRARRYVNWPNAALALTWFVLLGLALFISRTQPDAEVFDPFAILQLEQSATAKDIKSAYRKMSVRYHPDKTSDPAEIEFFTEKVTKAYQALTNEESKANFIKFGHPDGPQAMNIGVALPPWLFTSDKRAAPLVLFALVFGGLAIPILVIAMYLYRTDGFVGSNQIQEQTLYMYTRVCVKEYMRAPKVTEGIVFSSEVANMPMPPAQQRVFPAFVKRMIREYDLAEKKAIWNLAPPLIRAYLFYTAHFDRNAHAVPLEMSKEYRDTLRLGPVLAEEFVKAACVPRNKHYQGWLCPAEAAVQWTQCLVHAVRPDVLVGSGADAGKKRKAASGPGAAELMMLPGVSEDVIKALEKKCKVRNLSDLTVLQETERDGALTECGVKPEMLPDIAKVLVSLPHAQFSSVRVYVDGEADIKEADLVSVTAHVTVTRGSHAHAAGRPAGSGGVQAYTPKFPHPVTEKWWLFVVDVKANTVWANAQVELSEAEAIGSENLAQLGCKWSSSLPALPGQPEAAAAAASTPAATPDATAAASPDGEAPPAPPPLGQKVEVKFNAPETGKYDLTVLLMPSCWLGCDASAQCAVRIQAQSVAEKNGTKVRGAAAQAKAIPLDEDEIEERKAAKKAKVIAGDGDASASDDDDGDDDSDDDTDDGWDTEETGSDMSHSDSDEDAEDSSATATKKKDN